MKRYDYLIAGAGMAAASAFKGIREIDRQGSIALVGEEPDPPYDRPPLSKSLWKGKPLDAIWMDVEGADLLLGNAVRELRPAARELVLDDGSAVGYGKLLIATGGRPRRLPSPPMRFCTSAASATTGGCGGAARWPAASSSSAAASSPRR